MGDAERRLGGEPLRDGREDGPGAHRGEQVPARPRRTRTLVVWGANPTHSTPLLAHVVARKATEGRLVVVDPVRTELAAVATEHLAVRPGTDGALALGLIHVLVSEGLVDAALLQEQTVGFDALSELAEAYPPPRTAALTGVPADQILRAARLIAAETPTGIWPGLGVEHHENGVQTVRAIAALEALCRRPDEPEIRGPHPVHRGRDRPPPRPAPVRHARARATCGEGPAAGRGAYPLFEMFNREAQGNALARAILDDRPYPVRAWCWWRRTRWSLRPAARSSSAPRTDSSSWSRSTRSSPPAAGGRTWSLPAATFAEAEGLVPAQHEAWPDWKVVFELARAMGLGAWFPWKSWAEAEGAPRVTVSAAPELVPGFDWGEGPPRVGTPSGKIELASGLLARAGHPALPEWTAPSLRPRPGFR